MGGNSSADFGTATCVLKEGLCRLQLCVENVHLAELGDDGATTQHNLVVAVRFCNSGLVPREQIGKHPCVE